METKRKAEECSVVATKRGRHEVTVAGTREKAVVTAAVPRTSDLLAPTMLLEGHQGEIYAAKFHPEGKHLASAGFDRQIFLWEVYGSCDNVCVLKGHSGAITELSFCDDGSVLYTSSADSSLGVWDVVRGTRLRRLRGHSLVVNSVHAGSNRRLVSGADDSTTKLWDERTRNAVTTLDCSYPVTAVLAANEMLVTSGLDNVIKVWDIRKNSLLYRLMGHSDTVTGLALSPCGTRVASLGADNTLRTWDVRPWAPAERTGLCLPTQRAAPEKLLLRCAWGGWAGERFLAAGGGERRVQLWTEEGRALYDLSGHRAAVTAVQLHPHQPIVLSAGVDKLIYLGELASRNN